MRAVVEASGLSGRIVIDSAGPGDWHVGSPPDERAPEAAHARGYDLSALRARQVAVVDFDRFDLVLAMDEKNLANLLLLCPPPHRHKVRLLMEFAAPGQGREVADPYFGGADGFERVLDQCEDACRGVLTHLSAMLHIAS